MTELNKEHIQKLLEDNAESLPELLKHLNGLLHASGEYHQIFGKNNYTPYLNRARENLPPLATKIITLQRQLGEIAKTFSTPSFKKSPRP